MELNNIKNNFIIKKQWHEITIYNNNGLSVITYRRLENYIQVNTLELKNSINNSMDIKSILLVFAIVLSKELGINKQDIFNALIDNNVDKINGINILR